MGTRPAQQTPAAVQPARRDLRPCDDLLARFERIHDYIYANEGMLKESIFRDLTSLLLAKLRDEGGDPKAPPAFRLDPAEAADVAATGVSRSFESRLHALLEDAARRDPEMFPQGGRLSLGARSLAQVVAQLQDVSITGTAGDAKGLAFQTFVARTQRGDRGEFFTPHPVVALAVEALVEPGQAIIDPACGSGGFLTEAARRCRAQGAKGPRRLAGIEFNREVARAARLRLLFEAPGAEVLVRNALVGGEDLDGQFDVVLTNPPFGTKGRVDDPAILARYDLGHAWAKSGTGGWERTDRLLPNQTPETLFIERSVRLLKEGGRMAIVLPDGLLQNASSAPVRQWIRDHCHVRAVVSLPSVTFVPFGTGIKTSLLVVERRGKPRKTPGPVFLAEVHRIGYDVKGQAEYRDGPDGEADSDVGLIARQLRAALRGKTGPWEGDAFDLDGGLDGRFDVEHYHPRHSEPVADGADLRPLRELADVVTAGDPFRKEPGAAISYVAISDVDGATFQVVTRQALRAADAPSRAKYRVRAGDILVAVSGASTGTPAQAVALVTPRDDGAIVSSGFAVLRNVRGVDRDYLLAALGSEAVLRQIRRHRTGHAIPSIGLEALRGIGIPVPSAKRQKEVGGLVREMFGLREKQLDLSQRIQDAFAAPARPQPRPASR